MSASFLFKFKKNGSIIAVKVLVIAIGTACFAAGNCIDINDVLGVFGMEIAPGEGTVAAIVNSSADELLNSEYSYKNSVSVREASDTFKLQVNGDGDELAFAYDGTVKSRQNNRRL